MVYRFGQFEVNDREFRLTNDGTPVQLEPKVLRLLVYLVQNRNRLVLKQELLDNVWPDAMVTENALTRAIGLLRKALNEDSHVPRYIETVPTAGYRFIATVTVAGHEDEIAVPSGARFRPSIQLLLGAVLLLTAAAAGTFVHVHHGKKILTEKDTIVLADFDNSTGDPVFDGTLRRGMTVQLEQSPFLSLIEDDHIQQVLRQMGQPPDARLTPAIAREICERTASTAVLDGSIAPLGSQYVLGLRARDCQTGKVLAEEQVQATRKEDVLNALGQIAGRFRTQVGESLASVQKYDTPLADATTPSLEALKAYTMGLQKADTSGWVDGLPFFSRAVELDPNFAAGYLTIAIAYNVQREPELAAENYRKAYDLREKVSERERFAIEGAYYQDTTGELDKAESVLAQSMQTFPRNGHPHSALRVLYGMLGNHEKAAEEAREWLRLMPDVGQPYQSLGVDLVSLNRLDEAEAVWKLANERHLPYGAEKKTLYLEAFLRHDPTKMARLASSVTGKRGYEDAMLGAEADTEGWYGRLTASRTFTSRAMNSALNEGAKETAAAHQVKAALLEAQLGKTARGRADAEAATKLAPNRDIKELSALALAVAGDIPAAEKLAAVLDKDYPLSTLVQRYWLPAIRAEIALQHKNPAHAIDVLQVTAPLEFSNATRLTNTSLYPVYVRGEAYLALHDGNRAAAEFQKYIDHFGLVRNAPIAMLARLGLARAYGLQGNTPKACGAYQEFLTTWKDADPDLPILIQAKAEYAKLQ